MSAALIRETMALQALERIKGFPIGGPPKATDKVEHDDIVIIAREALRQIARVPDDAPEAKETDRLAIAEARVATLEKLRPHWAQGYSSDSIAAQASTAALVHLFLLIGAKDQTDAVQKLTALAARIRCLASGFPIGLYPDPSYWMEARADHALAGSVSPDASRLVEALIAAWEALPGGRHYSHSVIADWLKNTMGPAFDRARSELAKLSPDQKESA